MNTKWTSIWGNAVSIAENRPEGYAKNITLCYPICTPFSGNKLKLTFDNYCGTESISITKTVIYHKNNFYPVTFQKQTSCTILPGYNMVSDELDLEFLSGEQFEVRFFLKDYTQMRSCVYACGPLSHGIYAIGDETENSNISIHTSRKTNIFYFLSNISLLTEQSNRAIVCYGDSITAQDWPDYLQLRCQNEGFHNTSIIRRATSGSRILREYSCITYESYGLKGTHRFEHEVPTDGADTIIIQQGINDIIHPVGVDVNPFRPMSDLPTLEELICGMEYYISKAREYQYRVYVGTLLPIEGWRTYAPFREELRNNFNDWIRSTPLIDGCIDFDQAVQDSIQKSSFAHGFDSGDHLHPSSLGYKEMANAIPKELLK